MIRVANSIVSPARDGVLALEALYDPRNAFPDESATSLVGRI